MTLRPLRPQEPLWIRTTSTFRGPRLGLGSRVHEGHRDVADAGGGGQAFVVVGEAARVHEGPASPGGLDGAVVAQEPAATALRGQNRDQELRKTERGHVGPSTLTESRPAGLRITLLRNRKT